MAAELSSRMTAIPNEHGIYSKKVAAEYVSRYDIRGEIALVDADLLDGGTRHPNLAVMKLSGYFKENGCNVRLIENYNELYTKVGDLETLNTYDGVQKYDAIYISKVFDFTKIDRRLLNFDNVFVGGTGFFFDHAPKLPSYIEHHMPDYHVYDEFIQHDTRHKDKEKWYKDYLYFSIGFATRGCFRQCDFCVNHMCKKVDFNSHISEWYDPSRPYIYLWDDNILGYPKCNDIFAELQKIGKPFQFRQGMDMRLMTAERAKMLNDCNYYGDYIFAFDHVEDAPLMEKKLLLWRQYCDKPTKLYVLAGFDGIDDKEVVSVFERIRILLKYGCLPYIMRHENYEKSPYRELFIQVARWCNQPRFLKKISFRQYCEACQRYHKSPGLGIPYKAMTEFESAFPGIAAKYFDLQYSDQPYVIDWRKRHAEAAQNRRQKAGTKKQKKPKKNEDKVDPDNEVVDISSEKGPDCTEIRTSCGEELAWKTA